MGKDEILDRLGFDGVHLLEVLWMLSTAELLEQLNNWWPEGENEPLAAAIKSLKYDDVAVEDSYVQ